VADSLALYGRFVSAAIRSQLQYRLSFALDAVGMFLVSFLDFVAVLIIFHNVPRLGTFTVEEVAFLYATSCMSFAIADLVVGHLDEFNDRIRTGNFDVMLLRPRSTLFQVVSADFHLRRLGKFTQGAVVFVYAVWALDVSWDAGRVAMTFAMVICGAVIFVSVWVFMICVVFWTVEGDETANAFTYGGQFLTEFPIDIYGRWVRRLLAYLIPMAFVAYFPALYVLDKPDPLGLPRFLQFSSPLVAALGAVAAGAMWRTAVRHYRSAGG
jgi:ABC-2 type transport system permease protein